MDNKRVFAISPKYTTLDFPNGLTIDNKIDIFADRVAGWQIGIAKEIIKNKIQHSGFALLSIVFSYFEMVGKYLSGYDGEYESRKHFKVGMKYSFPDFGPEEEVFYNTLYSSVRSGLYHIGLTKGNVMLIGNIPGSIGFSSEKNQIVIWPELLVQDIDKSFNKYIEELRDPKNEIRRKNFEVRFDSDNKEG
jgi:hypothetical protein